MSAPGAVVVGTGFGCLTHVPALRDAGFEVRALLDAAETAYDFMHSMGIDRHPYARLYGVLRSRMAGRAVPDEPPPATFADGVAGMAVLDAIRRADAEGTWVDV